MKDFSVQHIANPFHLLKGFENLLFRLESVLMRNRSVCSDRKLKVGEYHFSPALCFSKRRDLIEGRVDLHKIENFRIRY